MQGRLVWLKTHEVPPRAVLVATSAGESVIKLSPDTKALLQATVAAGIPTPLAIEAAQDATRSVKMPILSAVNKFDELPVALSSRSEVVTSLNAEVRSVEGNYLNAAMALASTEIPREIVEVPFGATTAISTLLLV